MQMMPASRALTILARAFTGAGLSLAILATAPDAASAQLPADGVFADPTVASYRLTAEKLDSFIAAVHAIDSLGESGAMAGMNEVGDDADLSEIVAALDAEPAVRDALAGAEISSQEYVTFMLALVRAMFGSIAYELGGDEGVNEIEDEVLRENVRFYVAHKDVFDRMGEEGEP